MTFDKSLTSRIICKHEYDLISVNRAWALLFLKGSPGDYLLHKALRVTGQPSLLACQVPALHML